MQLGRLLAAAPTAKSEKMSTTVGIFLAAAAAAKSEKTRKWVGCWLLLLLQKVKK